MKIIFGKLISILFIITVLGFPVIEPIKLVVLFIGTILIIFGDFNKFKLRKNKFLIFLISFFIISNHFLPKVEIEEGSNFILFQNGENNALKRALPDKIYKKFKKDFQFYYETSDKICKGNKLSVTGCWRDYKLSDRKYSFSMDSIFQSPKYSRIVEDINFNNVINLRAGFLNDMKVDFNTNWFEWKSEGDPIREKAPFYINWEFPKNLSGKLCIEGKYFLMDEFNKEKFFTNNKTRCIDVPEDREIKVLAFNISPEDQLKVIFNKTPFLVIIEFFKMVLSILICILFIKNFFKINYEPVIITVTISFISFFFIDITRDFRGFFEHKYLYLGAGGDALTYWGFARDMMHSFLKGDILHAISGSEDIFFYMPGYRYFLFIQSLIFGETQIFGWFFIIITPSIIFFLTRKLTTNLNSHIITFLFTFFFIMNFYRGVFMHGEALAYPMALLSIIYAIKTIDVRNNEKLKNKYILYSCLFMMIGILCRPNLLLPAFLIHLYLLCKNLSIRSFFSFVLGYFPLLLMPLHNILYGGKFVLITSSATISGNMENGLEKWVDVFKDLF